MRRFEARTGFSLHFGRKFSERQYWFVVEVCPPDKDAPGTKRKYATKAEAESATNRLNKAEAKAVTERTK